MVSHSLNSSNEDENDDNKHKVFIDRIKKKIYDSKQKKINEEPILEAMALSIDNTKKKNSKSID